ncbi:MAG: hypothetical protein HQ512_05875, partial [Rhodospirillales bacterium]|nr:hypothetical protein [Rhodospirillales bacterium]
RQMQDDLRQAKDAAEAALEAKTQFLANMSHELRTPLNAILGFSEMLMQAPFGALGDERYGEYSDHIHESGTHLLEIINDILDLSRIEAGQIEIQEDEVNIEEAANRVSLMLKTRAGNRNVLLRNEVPRDLPCLRGDNRIFRQILINLLSNAIKFTHAGGEVAVSASLSGDQEMIIVVRDQGIGISAEDTARVMQPFGIVDGSMNRNYEGVGLGLPLTKSFVELHDGEFHLESEPGVGTTISMVFPSSRVISPTEDKAATGASSRRQA